MGLSMSVTIGGLSPSEYKILFGKEMPTAALEHPEGAAGYAIDKIATDKVVWTVHPEDTVSGPCLRCLSLDGTVFAKDDFFHPIAPLHEFCACEISPWYEPGHPMNGGAHPILPKAPYESLKEYFDSVGKAERERLIGIRANRLLDMGAIEPADLVNPQTGIKTAEQLLGERGVESFAEFDALTDKEVARLKMAPLNLSKAEAARRIPGSVAETVARAAKGLTEAERVAGEKYLAGRSAGQKYLMVERGKVVEKFLKPSGRIISKILEVDEGPVTVQKGERFGMRTVGGRGLGRKPKGISLGPSKAIPSPGPLAEKGKLSAIKPAEKEGWATLKGVPRSGGFRIPKP